MKDQRRLLVVLGVTDLLKVVYKIRDLDISRLYDVYKESLELAARHCRFDCPENLKILYAKQDFYGYLNEFLSDERSFYALWIVDGLYKAALRIEPYMDGLLLSGLETAPESRNLGYAKALVNAVCSEIPGVRTACVYSHVDKANLISLAVHQACGFRRLKECANYIDGSVLTSSCTMVRYSEY